jgi:hypothetical protein
MADALDRLAPPEPVLENSDDAAAVHKPEQDGSPAPAHPEDR